MFDDDRFWAVTVDYAKAGPTDVCVTVTVANAAPVAAADEGRTTHQAPVAFAMISFATPCGTSA